MLWSGTDTAPKGAANTMWPRKWVWARGAYPTRHDCYRGMRNDGLMAAVKDLLKDKDLEFRPGGTTWGEDEIAWNGNGVSFIGELSQWWSCQPESRKPQTGPLPLGIAASLGS